RSRPGGRRSSVGTPHDDNRFGGVRRGGVRGGTVPAVGVRAQGLRRPVRVAVGDGHRARRRAAATGSGGGGRRAQGPPPRRGDRFGWRWETGTRPAAAQRRPVRVAVGDGRKARRRAAATGSGGGGSRAQGPPPRSGERFGFRWETGRTPYAAVQRTGRVA